LLCAQIGFCAMTGQVQAMRHLRLRQLASLAFAVSLAFLVVIAPAAARDSRVAPALWKIETAKGRVWLFGSFHILPKNMVWHTPDLDAALQQAQELVFEINMDDAQDPSKMGALVRDFGFLPPGQSLHRMLATEYRAKLDATLKDLGLPAAGIDRMRPWLAALTITSLSAMRQTSKTGGKPDPTGATGDQGGADMQLWNWAKANNKERGALETIDSQIHIFADLTQAQEVQYLIVTLQQTDKLNDDLNTLINAWQTGNIKRLDKELNGDTEHFPQMRDALLTQRHAKWLPQIERMLTDGKSHVVIVGAAHLVGKGSVVDLLRAKGIRVEGP
jgi:uncharacterized protein YbaP (TraB family)